EDGIRDRNVTGVQTCALPISVGLSRRNLSLSIESGRNAPRGVYCRESAHLVRSRAVMVAGLRRLARAIRLVALGAAERGHQPDGDEKRAVLFADDLERRDIFFVAEIGRAH